MNNKHKHYDKIVAKAANVGLVQIIKMSGNWENAGLSDKFISFSEGYDYFLCLPQRKEACLHWLNGGEVQGEDPNRPNYFDDYANFVDRKKWSCTSWYMRKDRNVRIKPRKEKRLIGIGRNGFATAHYAEADRCLLEETIRNLCSDAVVCEIEVEV